MGVFLTGEHMSLLKSGLTGIALLASTAITSARAEEINPNGWPIPSIQSAKFYYEKQKDVQSEIPGNETKLGVYRAPDGTYFNTLFYNGVLYSFFIDTDGKPPMEYLVSDMDKDGIYETRYELDPNKIDEFPSPNWIVQKGKEYSK